MIPESTLNSEDPENQLIIAIRKEFDRQKITDSEDESTLNYTSPKNKDYRKISIYKSGKIEFPRNKNILSLAYCKSKDWLLVGGNNGFLKFLEIEHFNFAKFNHNVRNTNEITDLVTRHEPLSGHSGDVEIVEWRGESNDVMTIDSSGVFLSWVVSDTVGKYTLDMTNFPCITVCDFAWSPNGFKFCFTFKEKVENGEHFYGMAVGYEDGSREWQVELGNTAPNAIAWLDENKVAAIHDRSIKVLCAGNGIVMGKRYFGDKDMTSSCLEQSDVGKAIRFFIKPISAWNDTGPYPLAIVWEYNKLMLLRNIDDCDYLSVPTKLHCSCADWSPNGLFIAVGGTLLDGDQLVQVNVYNCVGKLLTIVNVEGSYLSAVGWDKDSLHLAMGAENMLHIASVRPTYKFASIGNSFAYAFATSDGNYIAFWNTISLNTQKLDGKVVDLKSHGERFALILNWNGGYSVTILSKFGVCLDVLILDGIEPISVCLTDLCLLVLSAKSILFWRYETCLSSKLTDCPSSTTPTKKLIRHIHIDEFPSIVPTVPLQKTVTGDWNKPTLDPAVCMDAKQKRLCVARHSGKLQIYSLPQGCLLQIVQCNKFSPYMISFNYLEDMIALIDANGSLRFGYMNWDKGEIEVSRETISSEILDLVWSEDMHYHLCIMERSKMRILDKGRIVESYNDINALTGYLAGFNDMKIKMIKLDEILERPFMPAKHHVVEVDMKIIQKIHSTYNSRDPELINSIKAMAKKLCQPKIWNAIGNEELLNSNFEEAEMAFIEAQNYQAIKFLTTAKLIKNANIRKAEILCFLERYDEASQAFIQAQRKYRDLAANMWESLRDNFKLCQLLGETYQTSEDDVTDAALLVENLYESGEIRAAYNIFKEQKNWDKMVDCLSILDDSEELRQLVKQIPVSSSVLLLKIAERFGFLGLTVEAAELFLNLGFPEKAVQIALENLNWDFALEIADSYGVPVVSETLLKATRLLLNTGDIMQAVKFLECCGKTFAAGKFLAKVALLRLQSNARPNLTDIKKSFILAAQLIQRKPKKSFSSKFQLKPKTSIKSTIEDAIDVKFDESIPPAFHPTMEELRWMRLDPWHGAIAVQYLIVLQQLLYDGNFKRSLTVANHLRSFTDVLGEERITCLIAIAAIQSNCNLTFLGAVSQLECIDEMYDDIGTEIFGVKELVDQPVSRKEISRCCGRELPDYSTTCPGCNKKVMVCIISGKIISKNDKFWTCVKCGGIALQKKIKSFDNCPLCHSSATGSCIQAI